MFLFSFLCSYLRSPDGACLLTNSDDNTLRIFNLPTELYSGNAVQGLSEMVFNNMLFLSLYGYKLFSTMTQLTITFPQPKYTYYIHIFFLFIIMNTSCSQQWNNWYLLFHSQNIHTYIYFFWFLMNKPLSRKSIFSSGGKKIIAY